MDINMLDVNPTQISMKVQYQVQSKYKADKEWLDDHLPFNTKEAAIEYIHTQPKSMVYRIVKV